MSCKFKNEAHLRSSSSILNINSSINFAADNSHFSCFTSRNSYPLNRYSLQYSESSFPDFNALYSSCPCVSSLSNSPDSVPSFPPSPPPRRAQSFQCVARHIRIRADKAQQSYNQLFNSSISKSKFNYTGMSQTCTNQLEFSISADNSIIDDIKSSVERDTDDYPQIKTPLSSEECKNDGRLFVYSYDPPTPERISEYDPPLLNYNVQNNSNTRETLNSNSEPYIRPNSNDSSSTVSASLLLTQDSDISPLPPHAIRVSPMDTDTITSSTSSVDLLSPDPYATYTCTSPAISSSSEIPAHNTDLSNINTHINEKVSLSTSPVISDIPDQQTPDTICVSPMCSDRNTISRKTSEDHSHSQHSRSDSLRRSEPTTTSSEKARRSSPTSSPDHSLSSLPSDTITMNAAIESLGTDSDPSMNREIDPYQSHDETDPATDSAFASPSTSPTFTKSCTITPIPVERRSPCVSTSDLPASQFEGSSKSSHSIDTRENSFQQADYYSQSELTDECTESESIYPESECDIRLISRADTDGFDSTYRDSSPEHHTTPIIAQLCEEHCNSTNTSETDNASKFRFDIQNKTLTDVSSSGNSSMSNSPALSAETNAQINQKRMACEDLKINVRHSETEVSQTPTIHDVEPNCEENTGVTRLSNWLCQNQRNFNPDIQLPSTSSSSLSTVSAESNENTIEIEEISDDSTNFMGNCVRNFPYFGPLPTIHEVSDTPTTQTPVTDADTSVRNSCEIDEYIDITTSDSSAHDQEDNQNIHVTNPATLCTDNTQTVVSVSTSSSVNPVIDFPLTSSLNTPQDVYTTGISSRSMNTSAPPPPPRIRLTPLRTPPLPPPPSDDHEINLHPLPPLPSEADYLPPIPPLPEEAPPIPPHAVAPAPPQRMYLLIPLSPALQHKQRLSPPPAPLRSTSLRRSPPPPPPARTPPPPPPRSVLNTPCGDSRPLSADPVGGSDYEDDDVRSSSTPSDVSSVICVSKLTPVPEENKSATPSPLPPALSISPRSNSNAKNKSKSPKKELDISQSESNKCMKSISKSSQSTQVSISSEVSISSPPPPPPPRSRISLTPPLPPLLNKNISSSDNKLLSNKGPNDKKIENKLLDPHLSSPLPVISEVTSNIVKVEQDCTISLNILASSTNSLESNVSKMPIPPPPPPLLKSSKNKKEALESPSSPGPPASPLFSVSNYGKLVVDRSDLALPSPEEEVGRVYTSGLRWGWLRDGLNTISMYSQLKPIIQHGPQCGLVALSMASQICGISASNSRRPSIAQASIPGTPGTPCSTIPATELLEAAKKSGFSTHGEMFSAEALASLANSKLGDTVEAVVKRDVLSDKHLFLELILSGAVLLVPYDSQQNHQPGLYRGNKAHWGVISGALVQSDHFSSGPSSAASFARPDERIDFLWHVRRGHHGGSRASSRASSRAPSRTGTAYGTPSETRRDRSASPAFISKDGDRLTRGRSCTPNRSQPGGGGTAFTALKSVKEEDLTVIVLYRQGKSRLLVSCSLEQLCASNAQLEEYSTATSESGYENEYIVGNVREGLAGQVVVINKTTQPLTALSELLDRLQS